MTYDPMHGIKAETLDCPDCGGTMTIRRCNDPTKLERAKHGLFYGCNNWPDCTNTHGAHPDGSPLGTPADAHTRGARHLLHQVFEHKWKWKSKPQRKKMYAWMNKNAPKDHIGEMDLQDCKITATALQNMIKIQEPENTKLLSSIEEFLLYVEDHTEKLSG